MTRERLTIETIEQVLPNAQIYIMNDDGETLKYLPIAPLERKENNANESQSSGTKQEGSEKNNE